ncbi:WD-repeat region-domain-containing protein [Syncephalastrum racemosum]|uniref:WD-repeat region-domain-containing protein n=1 Tax=Syncephalastrum racemosum TaxID=13706 RepID=A0A1X2HPT8_SYNRA|nr:WD-repeat region-domain-containing protein [Syncephalastrum racemosum]
MDFPLVLSIQPENSVYRGFITSNGIDHAIEIHWTDPAQPGRLSARIYGDPTLVRALWKSDKTWQQRIQKCTDVSVLLIELKELLDKQESQNAGAPVETLETWVTELTQSDFAHVHAMSGDLMHVTFKLIDNAGRDHFVDVDVPPHYPLVPLQISAHLPGAPTQSASLETMIQQCQDCIARYAPWFDAMDELDSHTRVLDPENPRRDDAARRLALTKHCSIQIEFDPDQPAKKPKSVRFFGSEKKMDALLEMWNRATWDPQSRPYANLARLLGNMLITTTKEDDVQGDLSQDIECGICYAYVLKGERRQTPDAICSNERCNRGFHPLCLYEWLRSDPNTASSFNVLFGKCPYCGERITASALF